MRYLSFVLFIFFIQTVYSQNISIPSTTQHSGGTYSIYRSAFDNTITINNIRKPLIWVEGFEIDQPVSIAQNYSLISNGGLASQLHAQGYDIVVLNYNDPKDYIQRNARLLEELIQNINNGKPNNEQIVVMGYSMGGLVSRYALVEMENNNIDHKTRLYISYDAPHKGAHIPVSIQTLALTFNGTTWRTMFPELADLIDTFNSPAATQMLKYRVTGATGPNQNIPVSTTHTAFMNEINSLNSNRGFPVNCQSVALSLGSWSGIPQRANFDSDGVGGNDFQYSGFPAVYINFPQDQYNGPTAVWNLNLCQAVAGVAFQSFLSTAVAQGYPYLSSRYSYQGLQNDNFATYWYRNSTGTPLLPLGAWSNVYAYSNDGEPMDFAPGSQTNAYQLVVQTLNSQINCSFAYYNNSTFVPTVSALAYNSTDLFTHIGDDAERLNKTPFTDIFAFCGENRSHTNGINSSAQLVSWLMNKVNGSAITPCYCATNLSLSGPDIVCQSGSAFNLGNVPAGASVTWQATPSSLFPTSSGTGTSPNISASNSPSGGVGTITFTVATSCNSTTISKTVWVGNPLMPSVTGSTLVTAGSLEYYSTAPYPNDPSFSEQKINPSGYEWTFPWTPTNAGWQCYSCNLQSTGITPGSLSTQISLRTQNACGFSPARIYEVFVQQTDCPPGGCEEPFIVYPNPTSEELSIAINGTENKVGTSDVVLRDSNGTAVYSGRTSGNEQLKLPVKNLKEGTYYLTVTYKGETKQRKILVQH